MWLQMISKKSLVRAAILGGVFVIVAWVYAVNSAPYEQASRILSSEQLKGIAGDIRFRLLTGFNITSTEGRFSTVSFYVFGTRKSGYLRVVLVNQQQQLVTKSATFDGQELQPPFDG
jgi:hypothetical protein